MCEAPDTASLVQGHI